MDEKLYQEMFELESSFWWFAAKRRILRHLIQRFLRYNGTGRPVICDIGCGCGALLSELQAMGEVIGIDTSTAAQAFCAQRGLQIRIGHLPDGLPLPPDSADVIILSDVLEHVREDVESVASICQLLRPGGLLLCTVPAHPWMWTTRDELHHHHRRYRFGQFKSLFEPHPLQPLIVSYYNSFLFLPVAAVRLGGKLFHWQQPGPDIHLPPRWMNALLEATFAFERHLLTRFTIPFGVSIITVHRRLAQ